MKLSSLFFVIPILLLGCKEDSDNQTTKKESESPKQQEFSLQIKNSFITDSNEHFRGLDIKDEIAYIAGSQGSILTLDLSEGNLLELAKLDGRHLRDIDVLDNGDIVALAITEPAQILLKEAESDSFKVVFEGEEGVFLDGVDFWNNQEGMAFGDPLDEYPYILTTNDGGQNWNRFPKDVFSEDMKEFAGFAASGTSLVCNIDGQAVIGLGDNTAKVLMLQEMGKFWHLVDLDYHLQPEGTGIYSMSFRDKLNGVAVGGHWQNVTCDSSKIYTEDGGLTWHLSSGVQEYRSCVTYYKDDIYVSTGTTGTDISYDGGRSWVMLDTKGYNAIAFKADGTGIGVGSYGQITLLNLKEFL